jgi:hypothetical protein
MHPLRHGFGSIAVIAAVLLQSSEAESYSAAPAQRFSVSPILPRAWRDPQPLHSARYGRIIDHLDVNAVLCEQRIARRLAPLRIPNRDRHNVGVARHDWRPGLAHAIDHRIAIELIGQDQAIGNELGDGRDSDVLWA